jgi:uncharacterized protein YkwD
MSAQNRLKVLLVGCVAAWSLAACGGGGGGGSSSPPVSNAPVPPVTNPPTTPPPTGTEPGAPTLTNNIAVDGRNWINFRRGQLGIPTVAQNAQIDIAAQGHSEYQRINGITHTQEPGKQGFTGATLKDRLNAAGWTVPTAGFAYGEVISATNSTNGAFMAEELITAIFHRFVIFQPMFKEIGTGAASTSAGYSYFTADFGARDGWGTGIAAGTVVVWPFSGQTNVTTNFFSDFEAPDPIPDAGINEVGYPISVEANLDQVLTVQTFTVRPRGGSDVTVRLLAPGSSGGEVPEYAAAIIPMTPLKSATTYDVTFVGTATTKNTTNVAQVSRTWSFTTK